MPVEPGPFDGLLSASKFALPDEVPALLEEHAKRMGAQSATFYLIDQDQRLLVPLVTPGAGKALEPVAVDSTVAGRCYRSLELMGGSEDDVHLVTWVPVVDGSERLGVLQLTSPREVGVDPDEALAFAGLVGELVMTKRAYGDYFERVRRRVPFSVGAELLWQLLPPLTYGTKDLVISAAVVPSVDLGGDAFDYAVDASTAQVAIFDGMGHGLHAGLLATTAVAAYRNARRRAFGLPDTAAHIDAAIEEHFGADRFVTGLLAALDTATGSFSWCVAGHPPPLLLRRGRAVKRLEHDTGLPFGVGPASPVSEEQLEPGDRVLLYTDGVTEARTSAGEPFGLDKLIDLISRTAGDDPPPEVMRRLIHAIEHHSDGPLRDDATVVVLEWQGRGMQGTDLTGPVGAAGSGS